MRLLVFVLSLVLSGALFNLGGCASSATVHRVDKETAVNTANINNLATRHDRLENRVDELAACCGKKKSQCRCTAHCTELRVHDPGSPRQTGASSSDCELVMAAGTIDQTFLSKSMVNVTMNGTGTFSYIDPVTGKECELKDVPVNFKGGEMPLEVALRFRGDVSVSVRPLFAN